MHERFMMNHATRVIFNMKRRERTGQQRETLNWDDISTIYEKALATFVFKLQNEMWNTNCKKKQTFIEETIVKFS